MHEVTGSTPVTPTTLKSPVNIGRNDVFRVVVFKGIFGQVLIEVSIDVSGLSLGRFGALGEQRGVRRPQGLQDRTIPPPIYPHENGPVQSHFNYAGLWCPLPSG